MKKFPETEAIKVRGKAAWREMRAAGINISQWCKDNHFSRDVVMAVLSGKCACNRGKAHEVAVTLGIKSGVLVKPNTYRPRRKAVEGSSMRGAA